MGTAQPPLPAGKGTRDLGEILRVHGQLFKDDNYVLERENDDRCFYINFEDWLKKEHQVRVKVRRVGEADGEIGELVNTDGIQIWKMMDNEKIS